MTPAWFSDCTAAASVVLETSGTVAVLGGGGAEAVVVGVVVVVVVASVDVVACVEVVACGFGCATTSVTGVLRVSVAPTSGVWERTVPAGALLVCGVTVARMSNVASFAFAASSISPVSFGIVLPMAAVPEVVMNVVVTSGLLSR